MELTEARERRSPAGRSSPHVSKASVSEASARRKPYVTRSGVALPPGLHPRRLRGRTGLLNADDDRREANALRALGLRVMIMVDGTGVGAGRVSRVKELGYHDVVDVQFAARAPDPDRLSSEVYRLIRSP